MAIVRQAEAVVASAAVIPRDVDTVVDAARVIIPLTLVDVCTEGRKDQRAVRDPNPWPTTVPQISYMSLGVGGVSLRPANSLHL